MIARAGDIEQGDVHDAAARDRVACLQRVPRGNDGEPGTLQRGAEQLPCDVVARDDEGDSGAFWLDEREADADLGTDRERVVERDRAAAALHDPPHHREAQAPVRPRLGGVAVVEDPLAERIGDPRTVVGDHQDGVATVGGRG